MHHPARGLAPAGRSPRSTWAPSPVARGAAKAARSAEFVPGSGMTGSLHLLAAGSLARGLSGLADVACSPVIPLFGASGLLRGWIEQGHAWDVFASADTDHPAALHQAGLGTAPQVFCHNALCLILRPGLRPAPAEALLARADLVLGMSTPGNDPSGDYAVAALRRLEALVPGAGRAAQARARQLTGAPGLPAPPAGRSAYAWLLETGAADMFLTYRTNGIAAREDLPGLSLVDLPDSLQVRATYALTTRKDAGPGAMALARRILSAEVQGRLRSLGFAPAQGHDVHEGDTG